MNWETFLLPASILALGFMFHGWPSIKINSPTHHHYHYSDDDENTDERE